jgi:hypothetical protein
MCRNVSYIQGRTICNEASEFETLRPIASFTKQVCITPQSSVVILCVTGLSTKQDRQCTHYITMRRFRETIVVV